MTTEARVTGERTCVGCRSKAHRSDLVRLVADRSAAADAVTVDPRAVLPGRGVWLHLRLECLDRAEARRAVGRGLRMTQPARLDGVRAWFETATNVVDHRPQESGSAADGHPMSTQR